MPYKITLLAGNLNVGDAGMRMIGLVWLLAAIGFVAAGVGVFIVSPWWWTLTLWVTALSLILSMLGWPEAQFGVLIDVVILAFLFFGRQMGWLPSM